MNQILVTIITVTFNAEHLLEQTLLSVINQSYKKIEYIIIDGGSTDNTLNIIQRYNSNISKWVSEKDKGIYDAMNKGIRMAKGELIGMINAGDTYETNAVETIVDNYIKKPNVGIFHGNIKLLDEQGCLIKVKKPEREIANITKGMCVYHPTFFVKKDIYNSVGIFDIDYKISADFDFTLRNYHQNTTFNYIDQVIANFRTGGCSHTQSLRAIDEIALSLLKNGVKRKDVEKVKKKLIKNDKRNHRMFRMHSLLKKFIPHRILLYWSQSISPPKK